MKKVLITALCLVMVGSVLLSAKGPNGPKEPKGPKSVQIFGVITGFDNATPPLTLTVTVDEIDTTVEVTENTVVMCCKEDIGPDGLVDRLVTELETFVKVRGKMVESVLVADKINVLCELPELGL